MIFSLIKFALNKLILWSIKRKHVQRKEIHLLKITGSPYPLENRGIHAVCTNGPRSLLGTTKYLLIMFALIIYIV